jgi:glycosyltransferase involved in cell wall biosynthesis
MNIIQVVNVRWFNATAWYALYLSKLLQQDGHNVLVLTLPGTPPHEKAKGMGLHTLHLDLNTNNPLRLTAAFVDMVRVVRAFRPDIVNCHRGEGFFLWGLLRRLGLPFQLVRTRGDQRLPRSDFLNRWLHRGVASSVVVTNKRMASHFLQTMRTPESRVWCIHGGVDQRVFHFDAPGRERVRREFGFAPDHFVIGLVGRFDEVKGQRELARCVARLRSRHGHRHVRLFYIGFETATKLDQVRQWIADQGIADITAISGKRNDMPACISALDLGVVASLWSEAIARAALEIMACQRPLVSSDVNVMPDLVPECGLFPAGDEDAMLALLHRTVEDPALRQTLVQEEKKTMSQLDGKDFLSRTLNLYNSLLSENQ